MSEDKPLHVRVAEALGNITTEHYGDSDCNGTHVCHVCGWFDSTWDKAKPELCVPRYDIEWSATGPLIEKYGITLISNFSDFACWHACLDAHVDGECMSQPITAEAKTPLLAVCYLILSMVAAGQLPTD